MSLMTLKSSIFIIFINLFFGAFVILQYLLIKNIVFKSYNILILILVIYLWIFYLLINKKKKVYLLIPKKVAIPFLIWIIYSIISFLLLFRLNYTQNYIFFSYSSTMYYPSLMIFYIYGSKKIKLNEDLKREIYNSISSILYTFAILIWPLGIMQFIKNNQIIYIPKNDYWNFISNIYFGHIRSTSFLSSALQFGSFAILIKC